MVQHKEWETAQILEKRYQKLPKKRLESKPSQFLNQEFDLNNDFFYEKHVLEIGVALSGTIHDIAGASLKVGLDPLAKYYASVYPKSAEHIQGRGEELPFRDKCLDAVICINTLDHMEKPNVALQQMRRCLKEDGLLLFSVDTFSMPKFVRSTFLSKVDLVHPHHFSDKEVRLMLKNARFEVISCFHKIYSFENRISYFKWLIRNNRIGSMLKYLVAKTVFGLQEVRIKCK